MKIQRLQVDGFGHFLNYKVELAPGLNVLVGSNEAGKSTLLAFIRAMLFGFERRNHPQRFQPKSGELGGSLELSTHFGPLTVRRVASRRRAEGELVVRGADGAPLPESRLPDALAHISRELFFEVFAFGLDELASFERLAAQGSVAEALFAAGMQGAHRLPAAVATLRQTCGELFLPRGKKTALNVTLTELEEVQERLRQVGDRPAEYQAARARLEVLDGELSDADSRLVSAQREEDALARLCGALPKLQSLARVEAELAALPDLSGFPEAGVARLEELTARQSAARTERDKLAAQLSMADRELALLAKAAKGELPEEELRLAWEAFTSRLREYRALPPRAAALKERRRQLDAAAVSLGLSTPVASLAELDLGTAARSSLAALRDRVTEAERALALRDETARASKASREQVEEEVRRLTTEVSKLPATPAALLRRAQAALERLGPARNEQARLGDLMHDRRAQAQALEAQVDPEPKEIFPAWALALFVLFLCGGSAAAWTLWGGMPAWGVTGASAALLFLAALVQRRAAAAHREQLAAHRARSALRQSELGRLRSELTELQTKEAMASKEVAALAAIAELPAHASAQEHAARAEAVADELEKVLRRESLAQTMEAHSAQLSTAVRLERDAKADRDVAEASLSQLVREVDALVVPRGFPSGLSASAAMDLWNDAAALKQRLLDLTAEERALAAEESSLSAVATAVVEAAVRAGVENAAARGPEVAANALGSLLKKGEEAKEERRRLSTARETIAAQLATCEGSLVEHTRAVEALLAQGDCGDPEAFRVRAEAAARFREARAAARELSSAVEGATSLSVALARERIAALGGEEQVAAQRSAVVSERARLEAVQRTHVEERARLRQKVSEWEASEEVCVLREREEWLCAQASELGARYAVDRLALGLLARARARFEKEQQPKVIRLASGIFNELTGGRYARVFASADGERDLRILDGSGREWGADQLSRGTREQLYLAFRLAVIEDFGEVKVPLPIIVDDILVNFDPDRQRYAMRVLARLSRRHQVIAFTCHPPLRELFRSEGAQVVEVASRQQLTLVSA
ncbi:MAG: AAA family ATPase [Myxococcota bacterium]